MGTNKSTIQSGKPSFWAPYRGKLHNTLMLGVAALLAAGWAALWLLGPVGIMVALGTSVLFLGIYEIVRRPVDTFFYELIKQDVQAQWAHRTDVDINWGDLIDQVGQPEAGWLKASLALRMRDDITSFMTNKKMEQCTPNIYAELLVDTSLGRKAKDKFGSRLSISLLLAVWAVLPFALYMLIPYLLPAIAPFAYQAKLAVAFLFESSALFLVSRAMGHLYFAASCTQTPFITNVDDHLVSQMKVACSRQCLSWRKNKTELMRWMENQYKPTSPILASVVQDIQRKVQALGGKAAPVPQPRRSAPTQHSAEYDQAAAKYRTGACVQFPGGDEGSVFGSTF